MLVNAVCPGPTHTPTWLAEGGLADQNKGPGTTIGVIPVDSNFSPVRRVRYEVGAARVGQRTDYDKLILEVETDGSIDPRTAVAQASAILIERL